MTMHVMLSCHLDNVHREWMIFCGFAWLVWTHFVLIMFVVMCMWGLNDHACYTRLSP